MGMMRRALLAGSESVWLRERALRYPFVRRSVSRFMPGEQAADALQAARGLHAAGITSILTRLGENLTSVAEAEEVTGHYLGLLDEIAASGLPAQISIKPTQLGLDQDQEACARNLLRLVERAEPRGNMVWIDMEGSAYVERTLALYRRVRAASPRVGVALQAYLFRTPSDLEALLPLAPAIRLVKGAYREPAEIALPRKADVDEAFFVLATRFLAQAPRGAFLGLATHDAGLVSRLRSWIAAQNAPAADYEFEMLFGIGRPLQETLRTQERLRVLVSYGAHWFPWYMRRLAERPANVWFVAKSLLAG